MKLFDKYFQPYAEYCLRTTLSEEELKEALAKECPATFIYCFLCKILCRFRLNLRCAFLQFCTDRILSFRI
jgi:hypothetical protein